MGRSGDGPPPSGRADLLLLGRLMVWPFGEPTGSVLVRGLAGRLLAMLAIDDGAGLDDEVLIDRLWAGTPPRNASFSLRNQVSALRRALGHDSLVRTAGGYRLEPELVRTDVQQFGMLVDAAELARGDGELGLAVDRVEAALGLRRGEILPDVRHEGWAVRWVAAVEERIRTAEDLWSACVLRDHLTPARLERLRTLAEQQPLREGRWVHLIDGYVLAGRRSEALRAAHDVRRALADVGLRASGDVLRAEQRAVALDVAETPVRGIDRLRSSRRGPFVGRSDVVEWLRGPAPVKLVDGVVGVGLTRVLAEFGAAEEDAGATVLYVRVDEAKGDPRFASALALELVAAADRAAVDEMLRPLIDTDGGSPALGDLTAASAGVRRAVQRLLEDLAEVNATVLIVDDAHLLVSDSRQLLTQLVDEGRSRARFVVAGRSTDRTGDQWIEAAGVRWSADRLHIGPLDRAAVDELVVTIGTPPEVSEDVASRVWDVSGGLPGVAVRVLAACRREGWAQVEDRSWSTELDGALSHLGDAERRVLEVLALLDHAVHGDVVVVGSGLEPDEVAAALHGLDAASVIDRHGASVSVVEAGHAALARALAPQGAADALWARIVASDLVLEVEPALALRWLLGSPALRAAQPARLDAAYVGAVARLVQAGAAEAALAATKDYAAVAGPGDGSALAVRARLVAATHLLASAADTPAGLALLSRAEPQAAALDDPALLADAALARGPVDIGARHPHRTADAAEHLERRLPDDDIERRVQLLCWAAHHRVNVGERTPALALLGRAEQAALASPNPTWRSLALGVRAQVESMASGSPAGALRARDDLRRWADLSGCVTAEAAADLLGAGIAFGTGTLEDVHRAADAIAAVSRLLPRPDLVWFPAAVRAAAALAEGDPGSGRSCEAAATLGRSLGVAGAPPIGLLHQVLLQLRGGGLGSLVAVLEAAAADGSVERRSLYALACVQLGELDRARVAARALAEHRPLLGGVGTTWPLVVMAVAEVAWALRDAELASMVWADLTRWSGWGLSVNGLAYVGAADTWLGIAAAAMDRRPTAMQLVRSGRDQDAARGAATWATRADELLDELGG